MTVSMEQSDFDSGRQHMPARAWGFASRVRGATAGALLLALASSLFSQTRLEQLEATYQTNLRTLHAPVLQDYARQLELLKNQLIARNRVADAKQVEAEIAKVRDIANGTGVLPYTELQASMAPPAMAMNPGGPGLGPKPPSPPPTPGSPATAAASALPTLLAAEAFRGNDINTKTSAIPLGTAEWRIFRLPAGTYDVLVIFSSETLANPAEVTLNLGGQEAKGAIKPEQSTGSPETFRVHRLCQVKVDSDLNGSTLALTATSQDKPQLWIKKIIFTLPKKGAAAPMQAN